MYNFNNKLIYNVLVEDINAGKINYENIFNCSSVFISALKSIPKNCYDNFCEFSAYVSNALKSAFNSRTEYEVIVTSWPTNISDVEFLRLEEKRNKAASTPFRHSVNLDTHCKLDVYKQIQANWDIFIDYLWSHKELMKKL